MSKRQKLTVCLPNLTPEVTLPRHQGKVLNHIIVSRMDGINTLQLSEAGCLNSAKAISALRERGALIPTILQDAKDSGGEVHPRVTHYYYLGWQTKAVWPNKESDTKRTMYESGH